MRQYYGSLKCNKKVPYPGACPGFLKGGYISWFPKKKSSDFKGGGVQWSDRGFQNIKSP